MYIFSFAFSNLERYKKAYQFANFPFIQTMIEKNDYADDSHFVYIVVDDLQGHHFVPCMGIIKHEVGLRNKIQAIEVAEFYRHKKYGTFFLSELKEESKIIEVHSSKEAENFYLTNGFASTKKPGEFLWVRI